MRTLEPESRSLPPEPHLQRVHLLFVQEVVCQLRRALARGSMHVAQVGIVASESRAATGISSSWMLRASQDAGMR